MFESQAQIKIERWDFTRALPGFLRYAAPDATLQHESASILPDKPA